MANQVHYAGLGCGFPQPCDNGLEGVPTAVVTSVGGDPGGEESRERGR